MLAGSVASLGEMGRTLQKEKFEHVAAVTAREQAIDAGFKDLDTHGAAKKPVLEDDLTRELLKEKVRLWVRVHADLAGKLGKWGGEKAAYLDGIDTRKILSVQDAQLQLGLLQAFKSETADVTGGEVKRLKGLGDDIRNVRLCAWRMDPVAFVCVGVWVCVCVASFSLSFSLSFFFSLSLFCFF